MTNPSVAGTLPRPTSLATIILSKEGRNVKVSEAKEMVLSLMGSDLTDSDSTASLSPQSPKAVNLDERYDVSLKSVDRELILGSAV